jgi:hypothetical protein
MLKITILSKVLKQHTWKFVVVTRLNTFKNDDKCNDLDLSTNKHRWTSRGHDLHYTLYRVDANKRLIIQM